MFHTGVQLYGIEHKPVIDVPVGKQRYHYKDGSVKWVDKEPYHRGVNNDNKKQPSRSTKVERVLCVYRYYPSI